LSVLSTLCEFTPDGESSETAALRTRLSEHRHLLSGDLHPQEERREATACVRTCEQLLRHVQQDHQARETELTEMIGLLRQAATRLIGDSSDFRAEVLSSADRFRQMTHLDDIRELKRELSTEITSLERAVEEKKERDQQAIERLSERIVLLQADLGRAEELASLDPLTKVANRGSFDRALARMIEAARAARSPLTLAMIDLDHFKSINDAHGHLVGDRVLLCLAERLRASTRQSDFVARYGGEEFAVILPGLELRQAESRFAQILRDIAGHSYDYEEGNGGALGSLRFTASCGLSQLADADRADDLIGRADQALYEAKQKGRNRAVARKYSRLARLFG
jgi:diguanylate cyclase